MSTRLGAAVVGTGFGVITHARALDAAGIEVRALVGRDPEKTAQRAALYGIPHAITDRAEAFGRDDIDVVAVTTPPHTHAEIVLDAVAAGKHVLCEKPFARDVGEAREMLRAAEAAGVVHLLGTEFRFAPGQALLTRTVRSGAIGEPRFFLFVLQLPTLHDPAAVMPAWWDDAEQGGGWLGAHGTHMIDQVRTTMGEITRVSAALETLSPRPMTADDTYSVQFETADGATRTPAQLVRDRRPVRGRAQGHRHRPGRRGRRATRCGSTPAPDPRRCRRPTTCPRSHPSRHRASSSTPPTTCGTRPAWTSRPTRASTRS